MTRSRYGMLAGIASAAFAAYWWRKRRSAFGHNATNGEVIFSNSPRVSEMD